MTQLPLEPDFFRPLPTREKFADPDWTAKGDARACVGLNKLETLWVNTGSLCNIECVNCYVESSPSNDRLVYITASETVAYLDEIQDLGMTVREIGFTGGEPFMNPDIHVMAEHALIRGHDVLILTNAMQPMQRKHVKHNLLELRQRFGEQLLLRVSLDHYTAKLHETERGPNSWKRTIEGLDWLSRNGFRIAIAGRTCWNEDEDSSRAGYAGLIAEHGWRIDSRDKSALVMLPEMDECADAPEITNACWELLGVDPRDIMCASSRMVVKRKGDTKPTVLPCTLLPYDSGFEMGSTLAASLQAHGGMFDRGAVKLCHPHCAKFCVLGGGNCSG